MFRLPYERHRTLSQGSVAAGLRVVHHAAVSPVPQGHDDMVARLENGWKGLRDVKGFKQELEVRIKAFIMKVDKSKSRQYRNSIPGANEPWKGEILFPPISTLASVPYLCTPTDTDTGREGRLAKRSYSHPKRRDPAERRVQQRPGPRRDHPSRQYSPPRHNQAKGGYAQHRSRRVTLLTVSIAGNPDEWHYRRGWMNDRGGFSFTLWTLRYTGLEGERFFDVMFAERHSGAFALLMAVWREAELMQPLVQARCPQSMASLRQDVRRLLALRLPVTLPQATPRLSLRSLLPGNPHLTAPHGLPSRTRSALSATVAHPRGIPRRKRDRPSPEDKCRSRLLVEPFRLLHTTSQTRTSRRPRQTQELARTLSRRWIGESRVLRIEATSPRFRRRLATVGKTCICRLASGTKGIWTCSRRGSALSSRSTRFASRATSGRTEERPRVTKMSTSHVSLAAFSRCSMY